MKKFRFKYSPVIYVLLAAVIALALAGLVWNIFNIAAMKEENVIRTVTYSLIILVTLILIAIAVSVAVYSRYTVKDEVLHAHFGFIETSVKISDITQITYFKKSGKLVMYFSDAKYSVAIISKAYYDPFVLALREVNPLIIYNNDDGDGRD